MKYNVDEINKINIIFDLLKKNNVIYVALSGYKKLPYYKEGRDIDLFIHPKDFDVAESFIVNNLTLKKSIFRNTIDKAWILFRKIEIAFKNPKKAIIWLIRMNKKIFSKTLKYNRNQEENHSFDSKNKKINDGNIIMHIVNNLHYKSPQGERVRVNPKIESMIFQHKQKYHNKVIYIPSPPEELAHLFCKALFDKEGSFPDYYKDTMNILQDMVMTNHDYNERFKEILSMLFYKADKLVYGCVLTGGYDEIKQQLILFDQY